MALKLQEFCPPVDAMTLLEFRNDAFQAWMDAPGHQHASWVGYYRRLARLVDHARQLKYPIRLPVS